MLILSKLNVFFTFIVKEKLYKISMEITNLTAECPIVSPTLCNTRHIPIKQFSPTSPIYKPASN